ncbi:hypothetical protein CCYA_CCYA17G4273 [Cyanidiococcus yangmingshanensis]|nr:hypothetical protein CCYA_CCYA17G4273 [Cyanidiococcus yangmingshanensis]
MDLKVIHKMKSEQKPRQGNMNLFDHYLERGAGKRRKTRSGDRGSSRDATWRSTQRNRDGHGSPSARGAKQSRKRGIFQLDDGDVDDDGTSRSQTDTLRERVTETLTHHGKPLDLVTSSVSLGNRRRSHLVDHDSHHFDDTADFTGEESSDSDDQYDGIDLLSALGGTRHADADDVHRNHHEIVDGASKPRFRDLMQHWIRQREQAKQERQTERLLLEQQTADVDETFRLLRGQLLPRQATDEHQLHSKSDPASDSALLDDYDRALLDMADGRRAKPDEPISMREARRQEELLRLSYASEEADITGWTDGTALDPRQTSATVQPCSQSGPGESVREGTPSADHQPASSEEQHVLDDKLTKLERLWQTLPSVRGNESLSSLLRTLRDEAIRTLAEDLRDRQAPSNKLERPTTSISPSMKPASAAYIALGKWSLEQLQTLDQQLASLPEQLDDWTQDPKTWQRLWSGMLIWYSLSGLYPHTQARHPVIAPLVLIISHLFERATLVLERTEATKVPTQVRMRSLALLLTLGHLWIERLVRPSTRFWPETFGFLRALLRHLLVGQCPPGTTDERACDEASGHAATAHPETEATRPAFVDHALDQVYRWSVPLNTETVDAFPLVVTIALLCGRLLQSDVVRDDPTSTLKEALQTPLSALIAVTDPRLQVWCKRFLYSLQAPDAAARPRLGRRPTAKQPKLLNPRLEMDRPQGSEKKQAAENQRLRQQVTRERRATARVLRRRHEVHAAHRLQAENSIRARLQRRERQIAGLLITEQNRDM